MHFTQLGDSFYFILISLSPPVAFVFWTISLSWSMLTDRWVFYMGSGVSCPLDRLVIHALSQMIQWPSEKKLKFTERKKSGLHFEHAPSCPSSIEKYRLIHWSEPTQRIESPILLSAYLGPDLLGPSNHNSLREPRGCFGSSLNRCFTSFQNGFSIVALEQSWQIKPLCWRRAESSLGCVRNVLQNTRFHFWLQVNVNHYLKCIFIC